jgi:2-polyprenyl-3-methyl-5-hydroxy-6-metoxy-1,4-benzoquinol methylase
MIESEQQLQDSIGAYYTHYYCGQLGLRSWQQRVERRLDEENNAPQRTLDWIQDWLNYSFVGKRVLVVGGGTGAEVFALQSRKATVAAIEPDTDAIGIIEAKARLRHEIPNPAVQAIGEHLPYSDGYFDFIYCFQVLEHTQHPVRCIDEMIRVVRKKGWIFISTPDYRQPYEPHYKVPAPTFAPKWVTRLWLRLLGRPVRYLDTLQFVNARRLRNVFQHRPVTAFQVIHSWPTLWFQNPTVWNRLYKWITENFGIQKNQWWLLQKLEKPR